MTTTGPEGPTLPTTRSRSPTALEGPERGGDPHAPINWETFLWVVRRYENAHVIFLVSTGLGGMLGAGLVPGEIFVGVRDAHIHLNVLGWAGITVLTPLVVFGPALLRVRIEEGAEQRASDALRRAIFGIGIGALGLLPRGFGRSIGDGAEAPATVLLLVGMAVYLKRSSPSRGHCCGPAAHTTALRCAGAWPPSSSGCPSGSRSTWCCWWWGVRGGRWAWRLRC
jgi:hypothetical protein